MHNKEVKWKDVNKHVCLCEQMVNRTGVKWAELSGDPSCGNISRIDLVYVNSISGKQSLSGPPQRQNTETAKQA